MILILLSPCRKYFACAFPQGGRKSGSATQLSTEEWSRKGFNMLLKDTMGVSLTGFKCLSMIPFSDSLLYPVVITPVNVFYTYSPQVISNKGDLFFPFRYRRLLVFLHLLVNVPGVVMYKPEYLTEMAPPYPVSLCPKWRNKFLLGSWLKIQHPGGWHAAHNLHPQYIACSI